MSRISGIGEGLGQSLPCAACNCLYRTCSPSCELAPFFPAGSEKYFRDCRAVVELIKTAQDGKNELLMINISNDLRAAKQRNALLEDSLSYALRLIKKQEGLINDLQQMFMISSQSHQTTMDSSSVFGHETGARKITTAAPQLLSLNPSAPAYAAQSRNQLPSSFLQVRQKPTPIGRIPPNLV